MKTGYIYVIYNRINHKCYIGQTIRDPSIRIQAHFRGKGGARLLTTAVNKLGVHNFGSHVIPTPIPVYRLDYMEQAYIISFNSMSPYGYNISAGGKHKTDIDAYPSNSEQYRKTIEHLRAVEEQRQLEYETLLSKNRLQRLPKRSPL